MKLIKFLIFLSFYLFGFLSFGQVQVGEGTDGSIPPLPPSPPGLPQPNMTPNIQGINSSDESMQLPAFSPLTDPEELTLIEGLDEPLERLRLRDQDTNMILDMIQLITGRYILRPQNLPAVKITFDSMSVLTKRETLLAVESLLAMNGIGITKIDDRFYKAVPAQGINIHVPIWLDIPASSLPPSQRIYMKMFTLKYAPVVEVREQLNAFSTPNVGSLLVFEKSNSILITDSLLNLQRMEDVIEKVDKPVHSQFLSPQTQMMMSKVIQQEEQDRNITQESFSANGLENNEDQYSTEFFVFTALYGDVSSLKKNLDSMIEKSLKPFLGGNTMVEVNNRTNQIYIVANKANMKILKFWLYKLDQEIKISTQSKLYKLQHADAKDVHRILVEVIKQQLEVSEEIQETQRASFSDRVTTNKEGTQVTPTVNTGVSKTTRRGSRALGEEESIDFSPLVSISVAERSNSILAYGMPTDILLLDQMIGELDEPLPLARIDTIFVMVDLSDKRQRGIDALFQDLEWSDDSRTDTRTVTDPGPDGIPGNLDDFEKQVNSEVGENVLDGVFKVPGLASAVPFQMQDWKLKKIQWSQIFSVASERNDVRIFSTPSIMVSHNAESVHIKIEDERNVVIPTIYGNLNSGGDSSNAGQRDPITASTELEIKKPKIGLSTVDEDTNETLPGSIFMEVTIKAEKFDETQSNVYQGQNLPGRKRREAMSTISIMDGEILVLGGLQEVKMDSSETRFNLLSDIPYFGEKFFRPKSLQYTPTELLIFLRPTIIDPKAKKNALTAKKEELVQAREIFNRRSNEELDKMLKPTYTPTFKSTSGRVLGVPDLDGRTPSSKDLNSIKPRLD